MTRCCLLALAILSAAGCLASPPAAVEQDGGGDPCSGLGLVIDSFDGGLSELWDPSDATYSVTDGVITMTADAGESALNSFDAYERTGALAVGPVRVLGSGFAYINLYTDDSPTARISIDDTSIDLVAPPEYHTVVDRIPEQALFRIGFANGEIIFSAATDGQDWAELERFPDEFTGQVRVTLGVGDPGGGTAFDVEGVNTPETGSDCSPI